MTKAEDLLSEQFDSQSTQLEPRHLAKGEDDVHSAKHYESCSLPKHRMAHLISEPQYAYIPPEDRQEQEEPSALVQQNHSLDDSLPKLIEELPELEELKSPLHLEQELPKTDPSPIDIIVSEELEALQKPAHEQYLEPLAEEMPTAEQKPAQDLNEALPEVIVEHKALDLPPLETEPLAPHTNESFNEPEVENSEAEVGAVLADESLKYLHEIEALAKASKDEIEEQFEKSILQRALKLPHWIQATIIAVVLAIVLSSAILTHGFGLFYRGTMPNVLGLRQDEAVHQLEAQGFKVNIEPTDTQDVAYDGLVLASSPSQNDALSAGQTITLNIGKIQGETQAVPNLVGQTENDAIQNIGATNFFIKDDVTYAHSDTVPKGQIIAQAPLAGTVRLKGTKIDLLVSLGPASSDAKDQSTAQVSVPDLIGMDENQAESLLIGMGLKYQVASDIATNAYEPGIIVASEPAANGEIKAGGIVTIHKAKPLTKDSSNS